MTKSILRKYAKLIVQMGVNIKKGQGAVILADTAQSEIALMVAEEAYRAGAKWVDIRWTNQDLDKMRYKKESVKVLSATQEWEKARMQYELDELPVRIWIDSDDPDGLKGVNVEKMQKANLARMKVRKPYRDAMENKYQWTLVHRLHPHPQLGEEGVPERPHERGGEEAVGRNPSDAACF